MPLHLRVGAYDAHDEADITLVHGNLGFQFPAKRYVVALYGYVLYQILVDFAVRVPIVHPNEATGDIQIVTHIPGTLEILAFRATIGLYTEHKVSTGDVKLPGAGVNNNQITTST